MTVNFCPKEVVLRAGDSNQIKDNKPVTEN
jgi:hypothetical protein